MLQAHPTGLCALRALQALLVLADEQNAPILGEAGACCAVVRAMDAAPDDACIQMLCLEVVGLLAFSGGNLIMLDRAGACRAIVKAMRTLPDSAEVQCSAVAVVAQLALGGCGRENLLLLGARELVLAALTAHLRAPRDRVMAMIALACLADGLDRETETLTQDAAAVLAAMREHPDDKAVQKQGVRTMALLVHNGADCAELCERRAPDVIAEAMLVSADDKEVNGQRLQPAPAVDSAIVSVAIVHCMLPETLPATEKVPAQRLMTAVQRIAFKESAH
ncbi:hypothetical protein JKP88DRAFT_246245 [Tribonema minus]|uniref:Uncharacterized protein n=1 Tax=Tribonema minus TaxID=303371 RepID=A0A835YV12_9STRA|nr:hypothetical protein JKP88DRAFT_246245 [Tribonema minus]